MNRRLFFGLSAILALVSLRPRRAAAQSKGMKDQLAGAWTLAAVTGERADGSRFEPFGAAPKGIIVFTGDGHFSLFQSSGAVPRIAANDRAKATADEATAIVREAIAYYGTYTQRGGQDAVREARRKHLRQSRRRARAEADYHVAHGGRAKVHQPAHARGRHAAHGVDARQAAVRR